ncbi:hypothetical protein AA0112_g4918 [Alternaria arborescens]|uniref:hypothetical protein n=1 Tax=Alternaria arborescens TaxID=156630 RepID=UPI00107551EA|nr:hypothetical protein AA0111_g6239 [Alternaria arborescens]RYN35731.1 hypothetical protein AA0112_g4918 [Alternaria arborescens]RYO29210.1 hypothetical protein AA0111_g6239 [Alternaria arborescens]
MPSMPFTSTPPNMQSNIISRLSAELRHIVYSHLNIPVGGHVWITGRVVRAVTDTSRIIFYGDARWPMRVHAPFGEFQVRRKINNLLSYGAFQRMLAELDNGDVIGCNRVFIERNLLRINKATRTELMDLVFGRNEVESKSLYLTPTEEVIALIEAFRDIAVTAKKLEMLHFAWNEEDLTTGQCQSSE